MSVTMAYGDERLPQRFWDKVSPEPNTGCWLWMPGPRSRMVQYGRFSLGSKAQGNLAAHRVMFFAAGGVLPDGYVVDHICRTRLCVNPAHLRAATLSQNMAYREWRSGEHKYRGVRLSRGKWDAAIRIDRRTRYLGAHASAEEAARAYDRAAREHYGEFAVVNFPAEGGG